jgi:hypothetical protein
LAELQAECIAIPEFKAEYLQRGHAVHFRCRNPDVDGLRIDVMSKLRGCDPFEQLWERRTTIQDENAIAVYEVLAIEDLVRAKKTQRDKDCLHSSQDREIWKIFKLEKMDTGLTQKKWTVNRCCILAALAVSLMASHGWLADSGKFAAGSIATIGRLTCHLYLPEVQAFSVCESTALLNAFSCPDTIVAASAQMEIPSQLKSSFIRLSRRIIAR